MAGQTRFCSVQIACIRQKHCCRLKWRQRHINKLTLGLQTDDLNGSECRGDYGKGTLVNDYDALREYLRKQHLPEFVLSFEAIEEIIGDALPRAAQRASWWDTMRSPQERMPQREACLAGGYVATRLPDGKSVRFKRMK